MSEINAQDIENWKAHFASIPYAKTTGEDLFVMSCLDTITTLRAELAEAHKKNEQYKAYINRPLAKWVALEVDNVNLRAELSEAKVLIEKLIRNTRHWDICMMQKDCACGLDETRAEYHAWREQHP